MSGCVVSDCANSYILQVHRVTEGQRKRGWRHQRSDELSEMPLAEVHNHDAQLLSCQWRLRGIDPASLRRLGAAVGTTQLNWRCTHSPVSNGPVPVGVTCAHSAQVLHVQGGLGLGIGAESADDVALGDRVVGRGCLLGKSIHCRVGHMQKTQRRGAEQ